MSRKAPSASDDRTPSVEGQHWGDGGGLVCTVLLQAGDVPPEGGWCDDDAEDVVYVLPMPAAIMEPEKLTQPRLVMVGRGTLRVVDGRIVLKWRGSEWQVVIVGTALDMLAPASEGSDESAAEQLHRWATWEPQVTPQDDVMLRRRTRLREYVAQRSLAQLEERERIRARDTYTRAAEVPSAASHLQVYHTPSSKRQHRGDTRSDVRRLNAQGITVDGALPIRDKGELTMERTPVTVTLQLHATESDAGRIELPVRTLHKVYAPSQAYAKWVKRITQPLLSGMEPQGQYGELRALALQAVGDVLGAKRMTWLYAAMGALREHGTVPLTADGELPDKLRLQVMRMTGCDPSTANARRIQEYRDFLHLLRHAKLRVTPHGKRRKRGELDREIYVPLLVESATDAKDGKTYSMQVNLAVAHHWMKLPLELLRLDDDADPEGVARALGVSIITRQQLALAHPERLLRPERMDKTLERAGLLQWAREREADTNHGGRLHVQREIARALELLRELPSRRGAWLDMVSDCTVTWGHGKRWLTHGRLQYGAMPMWLHREVDKLTPPPAILTQQPLLPALPPMLTEATQ